MADVGNVSTTHVGSNYTRSQPGGLAAWKAPELLEPENYFVCPAAAIDIYAFGSICVEIRNP